MRFPDGQWALILGGSSGFGLATAKKLAAHGLSLVIVHRDRRGAMHRINPEFEAIRACGVHLLAINADALDSGQRAEIIDRVHGELAPAGRVRLLLHSIALGNLKPLAAPPPSHRSTLLGRLAHEIGTDTERLAAAVDRLFAGGVDELRGLAAGPQYGTRLLEEEDLAATIHNMGTSLLGWVAAVLDAGLFTADARILGLTSEGNEVAWRGYAAVSAAKATMEALSRSMAHELAPHGLRSNIIQAGITETPASALIPGIERMKAGARLRNPFGRLTRPEDVANFIFLMCTDEAAWVNGAILRVDGGERISGGGY